MYTEVGFIYAGGCSLQRRLGEGNRQNGSVVIESAVLLLR